MKMKVLCVISDWATSLAERGRTAGQERITRTVLALDEMNWVLAVESKGNDILFPERYYGNMATLVESLRTLGHNVNPVIAALAKLTGKELPSAVCATGRALGKLLDDTYGTSFLREFPPKVVATLGINEA